MRRQDDVVSLAGPAVARFHIIDQSLCHHGGHHFDYVNCMVQAASENELETFVAANRRFRTDQLFGSKHAGNRRPAKVVSVFSNTTYQRESWLAGLRHLKRSNVVLDRPAADENSPSIFRKSFSWLKDRRSKKKRRQLIAQFARDLGRYFESLPSRELHQEDHVFFTTVSELELMGLAIFLANSPWTQPATWHLQFHYNLFDGRTPEFESQTRVLGKVRGCFLAALSRVPDHDLHFYCTSEELVEQFERLKVVDFSRLPYPINSRFAPAKYPTRVVESVFATRQSHRNPLSDAATDNRLPERPIGSPLRMICPGELRREKGVANHLQTVIDNLWQDYFGCGALEVAVQRPRKKFLRRQKVEIQLPVGDRGDSSPVKYVQHPLREDEYAEFIKRADFGLLMYDSRAYFSRRAGVLGELLACGKPVIVPAGCWLAHQLQEIQFNHIETQGDALPKSRTLGLSELEFDLSNAPLSGGLVSFDQSRHPFEFKIPLQKDETLVVVGFEWHNPIIEGVDVSLECIENGPQGNRSSATKQVAGHRRSGRRCLVMFRIAGGTESIQLSLRNAFHGTMATIKNLSVDLYNVNDPDSIPLGSVGLIAPDNGYADVMVEEMVSHFEHYRHSAEEYSHLWYQGHDPLRTLERLTGYTTDVLRRAA